MVRARQRSRTALRSFAVPLRPAEAEVGIDRMRIKVNGTWRCHSGRAEEYLDAVASFHPTLDWFSPSKSVDRGVLKTRPHAQATVSIHRLEVKRRDRGGGTIGAVIDCNPTRTLAHLLVAHGHHAAFVNAIAALEVGRFFAAVEGVPRGLDGNDNVIADYDVAAAVLGPDPFAAFLPVFADQLQRLVMHLLAPYAGAEAATALDHPDIVMGGDQGPSDAASVTIRMRWGQASVPQVETYFERFHAVAPAVVRGAGHAVLTGLDEAIVHAHIDRQSFGRSADAFSIMARMQDKRELAIYAKLHDRIRFEVRKKRGFTRYPSSDASNRLIVMMNAERALLPGRNWASVGRLFEEPDTPYFPDLLALIDHVSNACAPSAVEAKSIVRALLTDGGIQRHQSNARVIDQLVRLGVLQRVMIRHRAGPAPHRYSLTADYRAMHERLLTMFASYDDEAIL